MIRETSIEALVSADIGDGLFIDVGAFIGGWHELVGNRFRKIHAFEPMREPFGIMVSHAPDNVTPWPMALWDKPGRLRCERNAPHSEYHRMFWDPSGPIWCSTVDAFQFSECSLLKIDVEGAESFVLRGATQTIARCRPYVLIEDKNYWKTIYQEQDPNKLLESWGYKQVFRSRIDRGYAYRE